jgi:hypothetical protein
MSNGSGVSGILSGLSSALGALTPGQSLLLGGHLKSSNEAVAMQYISNMVQNPVGASAFIGPLAAIPNLPASVMTFVTQGIASLPDVKAFNAAMTQAQVELQRSLASENTLQQMFGV